MSVDRSVPSRGLDAEVAGVLGWQHIQRSEAGLHIGPFVSWQGVRPDGTPSAIPAYTTAPTWGSTSWGEMMAWLAEHSDQIDMTIGHGWDPTFRFSRGGVFDKSVATTIGHALAMAVLTVADWKRKETSDE